MAKKRKKNRQPQMAYVNAPNPGAYNGGGYPPYGYGASTNGAGTMGAATDPLGVGAAGYSAYGAQSGLAAGQSVPDPRLAGVNAAGQPATAFLGAAGFDAGLLQGLPTMLRSRHTEQFLLGLLMGGAAAWVLSDEELRNKVLKTGLKLYSSVMGGLEEIKEQVADVRAELDAEQHGGS
ncbi:hypothetical protein [Azomonas macrocytogenes]|uniref:YtxH domain-containing protein n=1 Tax=Azomonas macrocytogenes TaxID=69962 RepID=A0A839T193_AZOMA|nr:hypothetical protein [Azomonas macrocytogenes]MBB3103162.1 hypothetical protein [Azomonas macrocytogenes]